MSNYLIAIFSTNSFGQSKSDYQEGNFSVPSYEADKWYYDSQGDGQCDYKFSDGNKGRLYYSAKCGKYCIDVTWVKFYYPSFSKAIKALYAECRYGRMTMDGYVECND